MHDTWEYMWKFRFLKNVLRWLFVIFNRLPSISSWNYRQEARHHLHTWLKPGQSEAPSLQDQRVPVAGFPFSPSDRSEICPPWALPWPCSSVCRDAPGPPNFWASFFTFFFSLHNCSYSLLHWTEGIQPWPLINSSLPWHFLKDPSSAASSCLRRTGMLVVPPTTLLGDLPFFILHSAWAPLPQAVLCLFS